MGQGSLENKFKVKTMPVLKKFLQDCKIMVNSCLKPGLVAIARTVEEINLLPQCQTTETDEKLNMNHCLLIGDLQLSDPFTMKVINDFKHHPLFGLFDISTTSSIVHLTTTSKVSHLSNHKKITACSTASMWSPN